MRVEKTQISPGIHPVCSGSSLHARWVVKGPVFPEADSEDSDKAGRMPRLIWVFAGSTCNFAGVCSVMAHFASETNSGYVGKPLLGEGRQYQTVWFQYTYLQLYTGSYHRQENIWDFLVSDVIVFSIFPLRTTCHFLKLVTVTFLWPQVNDQAIGHMALVFAVSWQFNLPF